MSEKANGILTLSPEHADYHRKSQDPYCPVGCEWDEDPAVKVELNRRRSLALMEVATEFRETVNALVAVLIADGFSDEQARDIVAGFWRNTGRPEEKP